MAGTLAGEDAASWVVGDVQGCYFSLMRLLARIRWQPGRQRLWLLGDVVNRGAHSARTLAWLVRHRHVANSVMGNHDLGLMAMALGLRRPGPGDTAQAVLGLPGAPGWLTYLACRPWIARCCGHLLVHAGLDARWRPADALAAGEGLTALMASPRRRALVAGILRPAAAAAQRWERGGRSMAARVQQARRLVLLRHVGTDGAPAWDAHRADSPGAATRPWPLAAGRASAGVPVVFGHWSQLGLWHGGNATCLDTGCVWGRVLTAMRLPDGAIEQVPQDPRDRAQRGNAA